MTDLRSIAEALVHEGETFLQTHPPLGAIVVAGFVPVFAVYALACRVIRR